MRIIVTYQEVTEPSGNFRWWTQEMLAVGQFEFAESLVNIVNQARQLVTVVLDKAEYCSNDELEPCNCATH